MTSQNKERCYIFTFITILFLTVLCLLYLDAGNVASHFLYAVQRKPQKTYSAGTASTEKKTVKQEPVVSRGELLTTPGLQNASQTMNQTKIHTIKRILLWTPFFGIKDWAYGVGAESHYKTECPEAMSHCENIVDRSRIDESDLILVHPRDLTLSDIPKVRNPKQRWAFFLQESPYNIGMDLTPLNGVFNVTWTYKLDSDIDAAYGGHAVPLEKTDPKPPADKDFSKGKSKMVAWFASNCNTNSRREVYIQALQKYTHVDVYGKCGYLRCPHNSAKCSELLQQYKFYFAGENGICKDYITEKPFRVMGNDVHAIPIVLGGANYTKILPPDSFLDVKNFTSPKKLSEYLHYLDQNNDAYNKYFQWKYSWKLSSKGLWCAGCEYLHKTPPPNSAISIADWFTVKECMNSDDYFKGIL